MNTKTLLGVICMLFLMNSAALAQVTLTIQGNVTGNTGLPVSGQTVQANCTSSFYGFTFSQSFTTDPQGNYTLNVPNIPQGDTIYIQFSGADYCGFPILQYVYFLANANGTATKNFQVCLCNNQSANFSMANDTLNNMLSTTFTPSLNGMMYTYFWDFGDGNTSTSPVANHAYQNPGNYTVCLTVNNTVSGCSYTACDSILAGCPNGFWYNSGISGYTINVLTYSNFPVSWDFGDGTVINQPSASHTYATPGTYQLHGTVTMGVCTLHEYQTVVAPYIPPVWIHGHVYKGGQPVISGVTKLIYYDPNNQTLTLLDSTYTDSSEYVFMTPQGNYLIKASLYPADPDYSNYMPTYYTSDLLWNNATTVQANSSLYFVDINLVPGNNPGGPGFIGGSVLSGANLIDNSGGSEHEEDPNNYNPDDVGDPVPGIDILILDMSGNPVAWDITDANGEFQVPNLPYGTYQVYPEVAGLTTFPTIVTIDAQNPSSTGTEFSLNQTVITGLEEETEAFSVYSLYPNPATDKLNLRFGKEITDVTYEVLNVQGQVTVASQSFVAAGQNEVQVPLQSLAPGTYFIRLIHSNGTTLGIHKFQKN